MGLAVGANPVAFVIPCHRVIQQSSKLGGYHWARPTNRRYTSGKRRGMSELGQPDGGKQSLLVMRQQTIRYSRSVVQRYQGGMIDNWGKKTPLLVALSRGMVVFGHQCSATTKMLKAKPMQYGWPKIMNALCVHNFRLSRLTPHSVSQCSGAIFMEKRAQRYHKNCGA